jgi:hypothetical protein
MAEAPTTTMVDRAIFEHLQEKIDEDISVREVGDTFEQPLEVSV